jgi:methylamine dehydrogenase accessory protein MauD
MNTLLIVSSIVQWIAMLSLAFLLLGALRSLATLSWRLDQLEATMPSRVGRSGLKPGRRAPDFTLPSVAGQEVSLRDFAGRKVLLVFVQSVCGPCQNIVPELNRLAKQEPELVVLAVHRSTLQNGREWAAQVRANFPVVVQENDLSLSKRYEALATPFAFLINERGVVLAKGIANQEHHLRYILSAAAHGFEFQLAETAAEEGNRLKAYRN